MSIASLLTLFVLGCWSVACGFADTPTGSPCKHTFPSGKTYDFTGAMQAVGEVSCFTELGFRFVYAPCGILSESTCDAPTGDQSVCRVHSKEFGGYSYGIGAKNSISFKHEVPDGRGFTAVLTGGYESRQTTIQFQCDPSTAGNLACAVPIENPVKNSNLIFTSKYACAIVSRGGGSSSTPWDLDLSGGWIFIITLSGVALVYFVGGVLFQKFYKKERGLALLPNVGFWKMLPGLVVDGIYFSLNKAICCCRGQKPYEPL